MIQITPPESEIELLQRAECLCGKTLQQAAMEIGLQTPSDQLHAKGWVGEIAEIFLGATASNLAEPDFQNLGIELKTLPIASNGNPKESTYICTVPLTNTSGRRWEESVVKLKLSRVLWLPVEADKNISFPQRRFGSALLWSPSSQQEAALRQDWEELTEMISMGELDKISSSLGQYLQIRPKAANARALGYSFAEDGSPALTLPRGFYLRTSFTKQILELTK